MKRIIAPLAMVLSFGFVPNAMAAEPAEYLQDTLMLPVRTAAIVSALAVTTPVRSARGAVETARKMYPEQNADTLIFEYAAVPLGLAAGAFTGSVDGAGDTINKAWDKPFSAESFNIVD